MKKIVVSNIYVFGNGNILVFDKDGNQIPKLQHNIISDIRKQGFYVADDIIVNSLTSL